MRKIAAILLSLQALSVSAIAADGVSAAGQPPVPTDKLGPQVRKYLQTRQVGPLAVVLVGSSQLLGDGNTFEDFCREHDGADRRDLRRDVVGQLQTIADREQRKMLEPLGDVSDTRRLWIVNACWARLTPDQLRRAASLDSVGYIFVDWPVKAKLEPNRVEEVLPARAAIPFDASEKVIPWDLYELRVPEVWFEFAVNGGGVVVAMAGRGANYLHDDLRHRVWRNEGEVAENGSDDDDNGYVDDIYGYDMVQQRARVISRLGDQRGAWACGLVAGDGSGGTVTGAAPRAQLMLLKAQGSHVAALSSIQYAVANGADVMHVDVSYPAPGRTLDVWQQACQQATCAGLALVASAADQDPHGDRFRSTCVPDDIPCVLSVGGIAPDGRRHHAAISATKPPRDASDTKEPLAPTRLIKPDVTAFRGPGLRLLRGNSGTGYLPSDAPLSANLFASARAAGVVALLLSARPDLPAWKVPTILEQTATDLPRAGEQLSTDAGMIDAHAAVRFVLETP